MNIPTIIKSFLFAIAVIVAFILFVSFMVWVGPIIRLCMAFLIFWFIFHKAMK